MCGAFGRACGRQLCPTGGCDQLLFSRLPCAPSACPIWPLRKTRPICRQEIIAMISLADLQRRIDAGRSFRRCARSPSRWRRSPRRTRILAPSSAMTRSPRGEGRAAPRHRRRHQGHHGYRGLSDRDGLVDLQGFSVARRCGGRDGAEGGGRQHHRQDHDDGVCLLGSDRNGQSAQSRPYAGRIVVGLGGSGRRRHDPAGAGDADRRLGDPPGLVLRLSPRSSRPTGCCRRSA